MNGYNWMSVSRRPDRPLLKRWNRRPPGNSRRLRVSLLLGLLAWALAVGAQAQVPDARRAIEKLERCSQQERKSGCINILKRESAGDNKQAVKAQVRGGRIIWYEYNKKTGQVRRTN